MIIRAFALLLASICAIPTAQADKFQRAIICNLGDTTKERVEVLMGHLVYDTHVFYLKEPHVVNPRRIFDGEENESKGASVTIRCAGEVERVLILAGEFFGTGYPKGLVLRFNSNTGQFERIDFAERSFPGWVFLSDREMKVILPNYGRESDKRFIVYRFVTGKGQDEESFFSDALPNSIGYKVIRVRP